MDSSKKAKYQLTILFMALTIHFAKAQFVTYDHIQLYEVVARKDMSIQELMGEKGLVLVFTSSYCTYVDLYADRLAQLKTEFGDQGITFAYVNSNNSIGDKKETIVEMRKESTRTGFRYISDQSHVVKLAFEASKTPDVVVFRFKNGFLDKTYQGAIDDSPMSENMVKKDYLRLVLNNIIQNKPAPVKDTRPIGCLIK